MRSNLRLLLNEGLGSCLAVCEVDLAASDGVLFKSDAVPIDAVFFNGRVPGVVAGFALDFSGIVNLDVPPPKLPFGVGSLF